MDEHLHEYVREALKGNFSEKIIKERLVEAGFSKNDIDAALSTTYRELGAVDVHPKLFKCIRIMLDHNHTRDEIKQKLTPKGYSEKVIDVTIDFAIVTERAVGQLEPSEMIQDGTPVKRCSFIKKIGSMFGFTIIVIWIMNILR